jgi:hypothetical protein
VAEIVLSEEQKDVVRRYVTAWRRWRPGIRGFARLEDDLAKRYEVLVDGIAVDNRPGRPVIRADANDKSFCAAIFGNDDDAMPDMTTDELEQARRYIIHGEGAVPVRKWRERKLDPRVLIGDRHEEADFPPLPPAA